MADIFGDGALFKRITQSAIAANGLNSSSSVDVIGYDVLSVQIVWASHSDTSSSVIQTTNDDTNWDTIAGSTMTTSGASGSTTMALGGAQFKAIRITITETDANASATVTPTIVMRKG